MWHARGRASFRADFLQTFITDASRGLGPGIIAWFGLWNYLTTPLFSAQRARMAPCVWGVCITSASFMVPRFRFVPRRFRPEPQRQEVARAKRYFWKVAQRADSRSAYCAPRVRFYGNDPLRPTTSTGPRPVAMSVVLRHKCAKRPPPLRRPTLRPIFKRTRADQTLRPISKHCLSYLNR